MYWVLVICVGAKLCNLVCLDMLIFKAPLINISTLTVGQIYEVKCVTLGGKPTFSHSLQHVSKKL